MADDVGNRLPAAGCMSRDLEERIQGFFHTFRETAVLPWYVMTLLASFYDTASITVPLMRN